MLIGFSVSNFKSYNKTQSISFLASRVSRHKEHVLSVGDRRILKSGIIFGANASGKSNLIEAIDFSRRIIIKGLEDVDLSKKYFRISKDSYRCPGVFEYKIGLNGIDYSYGVVVSYQKREIISEWLVRIEKNEEETYLFNRDMDDEGNSQVETDLIRGQNEEDIRLRIYLEDFGANISDSFRKKTILSDIASRGKDKTGIFGEIRSICEWFEDIVTIFPNTKYGGINEIASDDEMKSYFSKMVSYFDTGIESVEGESREMDFDKILEELSGDDAEKIKIDISNEASEHPIMLRMNEQVIVLRKDENGNIVYNKTLLNHGNNEEMFEYADESDGTKRLFDLIPLLYDNKKNRVVLIDEIDRSLHTNLTKQFFEIFYSISEMNSRQLVVTTHDSNLLDLDLLRQDEIWFVERMHDHSSKVFSFNKFKERFDKRIDKEYLLGRYGAIPVFHDEQFTMEE